MTMVEFKRAIRGYDLDADGEEDMGTERDIFVRVFPNQVVGLVEDRAGKTVLRTTDGRGFLIEGTIADAATKLEQATAVH